MTFLELLHGAEVLSQSGNPGITGLDYDSRRVKPGYLFVAMRGESSDGNQFIDKAIAAGAVAIVTDSDTEKPREGVGWAQVSHGRRALARLSSNFYKRPAERLAVTGITGTNGKSTTTFLVEAILAASGRKNALIGTIEPGAVNWMTAGRGIVHSERTPPETRVRAHRMQAVAAERAPVGGRLQVLRAPELPPARQGVAYFLTTGTGHLKPDLDLTTRQLLATTASPERARATASTSLQTRTT